MESDIDVGKAQDIIALNSRKGGRPYYREISLLPLPPPFFFSASFFIMIFIFISFGSYFLFVSILFPSRLGFFFSYIPCILTHHI